MKILLILATFTFASLSGNAHAGVSSEMSFLQLSAQTMNAEINKAPQEIQKYEYRIREAELLIEESKQVIAYKEYLIANSHDKKKAREKFKELESNLNQYSAELKENRRRLNYYKELKDVKPFEITEEALRNERERINTEFFKFSQVFPGPVKSSQITVSELRKVSKLLEKPSEIMNTELRANEAAILEDFKEYVKTIGSKEKALEVFSMFEKNSHLSNFVKENVSPEIRKSISDWSPVPEGVSTEGTKRSRTRAYLASLPGRAGNFFRNARYRFSQVGHRIIPQTPVATDAPQRKNRPRFEPRPV
eukprot:NODE_161_length_16629_cov_0.427344.p5 type:complete len:306 gc:universal NODE_161_length_16629_cov_0.427344:10597-9680(-)